MNKKSFLLSSCIFFLLQADDQDLKSQNQESQKIPDTIILPILKKLSFAQQKKQLTAATEKSLSSVWDTLIQEMREGKYKTVKPEVDTENNTLSLVLSNSLEKKEPKKIVLSSEEAEELITLMEEEKKYQEEKDPLSYDNIDLPDKESYDPEQQSQQQPDMHRQSAPATPKKMPTKQKKKKKLATSAPAAAPTVNSISQKPALPYQAPRKNIIITTPKTQTTQPPAPMAQPAIPEAKQEKKILENNSLTVSTLGTRTAEPHYSGQRERYTAKKKFDASFPSTKTKRDNKKVEEVSENKELIEVKSVIVQEEQQALTEKKKEEISNSFISLRSFFQLLFYYFKVLLSLFI